MNITFLIGNGFDLNLGLNTRFRDFIEEYKKIESSDNDVIVSFKNNIDEDVELWSDAEKRFGEFSNFFYVEAAERYLDCHYDFCEKLSKYLQNQEERINYDGYDYHHLKFFSCLSEAMEDFCEEDQDLIKQCYNQKEKIQFNFINFNYTSTLDSFVRKFDEYDENDIIMNSFSFSSLIHVHGYTDREMVFGVNDPSQISNHFIFMGKPQEYEAQVIKQKTNEMNGNHTDEKAYNVLKNSDLLYIYGMSLGDTDALWWDRICQLMVENKDLVTIMYFYDTPESNLLRRRFITFRNKKREELTRFSSLSNEDKESIYNRIILARKNPFEQIKNLADNSTETEKIFALKA